MIPSGDQDPVMAIRASVAFEIGNTMLDGLRTNVSNNEMRNAFDLLHYMTGVRFLVLSYCPGSEI